MNRFYKQTKQSGFTIVELLIVIVVIGILAAIVIVAFTGVQNNAREASIRSDLTTAKKKIEQYRVLNDNRYPGTVTNLTGDYKISISKGSYSVSGNAFNLFYCMPTSGATDSFAYLVIAKGGKRYYISNTQGVQEYTGATSWNGNDPAVICSSVLASSTNSGAVGWRGDDTTTGPWRSWTGISN